REELLRFRGGTTVQAAVWDDTRFYTYDLLRLLPYTEVKLVEKEAFLTAAAEQGYGADFFTYTQAYFKVERWLEQRLSIELSCTRDNLECCDLIHLSGLRIEGHPQVDVVRSLSQQQILSFLVPLGRRQSQWDVAKKLQLSPLFGLYLLTDGSEQRYACAFNQDALLLKALSHRLRNFCQNTTAMIF
ncbi:MAG: type I-D CRISPR-associated helicase Cas3', partial [Leptolyngbya sp. SIO4C1]|nr:type I-D CRISPR-associated helicase Cas3' [Leptolyngbya sp. SIO4C1]